MVTLIAALLAGGVYRYFYRIETLPQSGTLIIEQGFHHLGDNTYRSDLQVSPYGDPIRNMKAEAKNLLYSCKLPERPITEGKICLYVNQLKPTRYWPVKLTVIGDAVKEHFEVYLNDYVREERYIREKITILLPANMLQKNRRLTILIECLKAPLGIKDYSEYEDFEFDSLSLEYR